MTYEGEPVISRREPIRQDPGADDDACKKAGANALCGKAACKRDRRRHRSVCQDARSTISFLISAIALAGLRPFGHT